MTIKTTNDFVNYGSRTSTRLKKWSKTPGYLNAWLYTGFPPQPVHLHAWHKLEPRKDRQTGATSLEVWSDNLVCFEPAEVIREQYFRHEDGARKNPPNHCPQCRVIEACYQAVVSGKLLATDVCFYYPGQVKSFKQGSRESKFDTTVRVHAAGIFNGFRDVDSKSEAYEELKSKHGIYKSDVWKENAQAKLHYVFQMVDNDEPGKGLQSSVEKGIVGQKLQHLIRTLVKGEDDLGDPFIKPYCVRFEYHDEEQEFQKKYEAIRMSKMALTEQIAEAIRGKALDTSYYFAKKNLKTFRLQLEQAQARAVEAYGQAAADSEARAAAAQDAASKAEALADMARSLERGKAVAAAFDWDDIFNVLPVEEEQPPARSAPVASASSSTPQAPLPGSDTLPCDVCKAPMKPDETTCAKCGTKYAVDDEPDPKVDVPTSMQLSSPAPEFKVSPPAGDGESFDDQIPF